MEYRHLLPDEFEDLIDGEASEELAGLRAHVDQCAECRAELATRAELTQLLERIPHHTPAPLFGYRVMSQVQVFEPWHVALRDTVGRFIPVSPAARWLAAATALTVAALLTLGGIWAVVNSESAWLFAEIGIKRAREGILSALRGVLESALGSDALGVIEASGVAGAVIAVSIIIAVVLLAAIGFRAAALASRRRRS